MDIDTNLLLQFNLDYLENIAGGDKEFMGEMIDMFIRQTPPQIESLKIAIDNNDYIQIAHIAHKIKPTFTMYGLGSLKISFGEIETCAQSKEINCNIEQKLNAVLPVLELLYARLEIEKDSF